MTGYPEKALLLRGNIARLYGQLCELVRIFISFFRRRAYTGATGITKPAAILTAVPVAPSYSISSAQTGGVIFSDGNELEGGSVITISRSQVNPGNSVGGPITLIL